MAHKSKMSGWKRRIKLAALVLMILLLTSWLANTLFVEFTTKHSTGHENNALTIMTYNLHGYEAIDGYQPAIELITSINPDILVLQEAIPILYQNKTIDPVAILRQQLGLYHYGQLSFEQSTAAGVAILSRYPIVNEYLVELGGYDVYIKYLVVTTIATPQGNLTVTGTHLELPTHPTMQKQQAERILKELDTHDDMLLLCDCNAPDVLVNPVYRRLASHLQDAWIADGHHAWQGNTWPAENPYLRVDYIWYKGTIGIVDGSVHRVGSDNASDHLGLVAKISVISS